PLTSCTLSRAARSTTASGRPNGGSWATWAVSVSGANQNRSPDRIEILRSCCCLCMIVSSTNLHHVIQERIRHFQKLVWHAVRHHDHITFGNLTRLPVADAGTPEFVGCCSFGVDGFSAGNKLRRSFQHVNYVLIFCMYLRLARFFSAAGVYDILATI